VRTHAALTARADFKAIAVPADAGSSIGVYERPETARRRVERELASDDDKRNSAIAARTAPSQGVPD